MAYCDRCDRYFPHNYALWQHEADSSRHNMCQECDKDYLTWERLKQHYVQSSRHHYCQLCDEHLSSHEDLKDHQGDEHYPCWDHDVVFKSEKGLHEHNRQKHWYCVPCRRVFRSESNLDAHNNSSVHKPKTVSCPDARCGKAFVSWSALVLHFEAGTCSSGMTRTELNRMVVRADRNNVITNPSRLITGPDGYAPANVTQTWATDRSWNGHAYECFLCHGTFRLLRSLNAHLQSPRHQDKIYKCPNRNTCGVEFRVLSSLTQHVESGKCGVNRFQGVQNALDSLVGGVKRLTI